LTSHIYIYIHTHTSLDGSTFWLGGVKKVVFGSKSVKKVKKVLKTEKKCQKVRIRTPQKVKKSVKKCQKSENLDPRKVKKVSFGEKKVPKSEKHDH